MPTVNHKILEYAFFFSLLIGSAWLVWLLIAPFAGTLALAAIIVTICYPLFEQVLRVTPRRNRTLAALVSVLIVIFIVVLPLTVLGSFLFREAVSIYTVADTLTIDSFSSSIVDIESFIQRFAPSFNIDLPQIISQIAVFISEHLVSIFAGTASTIFFFFISLIATFFFFRDGKEFTTFIVRVSPLTDAQDAIIVKRLATAVRSVALGSVAIALIQGTLTAIGLSLFGFDRAVLWGSVAAIGALIPGVGTAIVFIPAVIYLIIHGSYITAAGVALWGALAVGFIDNLIGPYLMSRGNSLHPFLILISVLGGIALLGPIGFILGPVIMSFFSVMIELYAQYTKRE